MLRIHHLVVLLFLSAVSLLAVLSSERSAHAEPHAAGSEAHRASVAIEAHLGLATPLGFAGVAADWRPISWLSIDTGIGRANIGLQGELKVRFAITRRRGWNLYVGAGVSAGPYEWTEFTTHHPAKKEGDWVPWGNIEVGVERRPGAGSTTRVYVGYGRVLDDSALTCVGDEVEHCRRAHANDGKALPYVGLAFGYAIGL